jgi:hypothetical protein
MDRVIPSVTHHRQNPLESTSPKMLRIAPKLECLASFVITRAFLQDIVKMCHINYVADYASLNMQSYETLSTVI